MRNARDFVTKIKLVLGELDDKIIDAMGRRIVELETSAKM